ncbi:MAG: hypothetical protein JNM69_12130 [Archangium sp.]|nr:hypothetical protein [Archangium sp.]
MSLPARLTFAISLALVGCSPAGGVLADSDAGPTTTQDAGQQPLLELGTGTQSFTPLTSGQMVTIIAGPQGGFHVWAAVRTRAPLDPMLIKLTVKVKLAGAELSSTDYKVNLVKNGAYSEWYAMTALIPDPAEVRGKSTVIELVATDAAGRTASDSRTVIPAGP